ncbi:HNH endonuclease signature motif containing protein [Streptomyces sp. NPDC090106]|uniref:HNH endonuclease signature motif containing protein n=1 Tax=Streptomyces sp. NPDC090106 TaxID=3365946 RepID=UPI0037FF05FE
MCSHCKRLDPLDSRCEPCSLAGARRREKKRQATRPSPRERGYDSEYRRARAATLAADPVCSICRRSPATTADHKVPLSRGRTNDIANLRPACGPCNFSRGNRAA